MQSLLELQDRDMRMAKIEAMVRSVPAEKAAVEGELKTAEAALLAAKEGVRNAEKAIKAIELEIETIRGKMRDFQTKTATIKKNDEYQAALHQIETCKKQIAAQEELQMTAMEALEAAKGAFAAEEKVMAGAKQRVAGMLGDLETRFKNCSAELERMRGVRREILGGVPAEFQQRYERLRASKFGGVNRVLVPIRANGSCDGCRMNVTAQIRVNAAKSQLATCSNCGRILYIED
jgi:predicted  nucleic acid-binding Zn-ribbon protein